MFKHLFLKKNIEKKLYFGWLDIKYFFDNIEEYLNLLGSLWIMVKA
jgi:hypothetical protein